jgi:hypothetical protein
VLWLNNARRRRSSHRNQFDDGEVIEYGRGEQNFIVSLRSLSRSGRRVLPGQALGSVANRRLLPRF